MKEKLLKGLRWFFESFIWLGIILLTLDIVSKNLVVHYSEQLKAEPLVLIPGFLRINYTINENVAFGISLGSVDANRIIFSIVAILVSAGIIFFLVKKWGKLRKLYRAIAMMILVGAIGNVIDRLFYTADYLNFYGKQGVVDWIDFYFWDAWKYNFNIADASVVIAAIMLLVVVIVLEIQDYRAKKAKEAKLEKKEKEPTEKILSATEKEKLELLEKDRADKENI